MGTPHPGQEPSKPVVLADPRAIRALAHPARLVVIEELFSGRVATATELADVVGLSPSATSYHLRALERWGILERAETPSDGRERPWKAAGGSLQVRSESGRSTLAAESAVLGTLLDAVRRDVDAFLTRRRKEPPEWQDAATFNHGFFLLTAEELQQAAEGMAKVMRPFATSRRPDPPPGARRVRVSVFAVPTD